MTALTSPVSGSHVEAYCSTGSSPGADAGASIQTGITFDAELTLDRHGRVTVPIRCEVYGPKSSPPVVVLGGISATSHLCSTDSDPTPGWWPGVVGAGSAIDPRRFRIVGVDYLGAPNSTWKPSAPITTADQAGAIVAVLDRLDIQEATIVGASYGGMVALSLAAAFRERVVRAVILCATHRPHPMATAVRSVQRGILRFGADTGCEKESVVLARALAMTTYRDETEFETRFSYRIEEGQPPSFPVEDYVKARGEDFAERFDADSFYRLSESIDLHDVAPENISVPLTLVSADSDAIAPPWLVDELTRRAPCVESHTVVESPYGHDAFLKETGAVSRILADVLSDVEVSQ